MATIAPVATAKPKPTQTYPPVSVTTVPANGDVNPYGIANVTSSVGSLVRGDILMSNFNDSENLQGTGTTIVQETPGGHLSLFARIDPAAVRFAIGLEDGEDLIADAHLALDSLGPGREA